MAAGRASGPRVRSWPFLTGRRWAKRFSSSRVLQTSICLGIASASSTSMPKYLTVLSICTNTSVEKVDLWTRSTVCFRNVGEAWKVKHVHSSVPFYMGRSFQAVGR